MREGFYTNPLTPRSCRQHVRNWLRVTDVSGFQISKPKCLLRLQRQLQPQYALLSITTRRRLF